MILCFWRDGVEQRVDCSQVVVRDSRTGTPIIAAVDHGGGTVVESAVPTRPAAFQRMLKALGLSDTVSIVSLPENTSSLRL